MNPVLYSKKYNIAYVPTPKVACTTIKGSLLDNPEGSTWLVHENSQFSCPPSTDMPFFAITRNPYARILSGYRDRIGREGRPNTWNVFAKKYSLDINSMPSFYEFLQLLSQDKDSENYDQHFRPQVHLLHVNDIEYDYLGRIENMKDTVAYLSEQGITLATRAPHKTGSSEDYRNIITKEEEKLINEIYREDFEFFGYEMKLESAYVPAPIRNQNRKISELYKFIFLALSFGIDSKLLQKFKQAYKVSNTSGQDKNSIALSFKKFVEDARTSGFGSLKLTYFRYCILAMFARGVQQERYKAKKSDIEKVIIFLKEPIFQH